LAGKRVLLVEDEALLAMLVQEWLEEAGATVVGPARSTAQALRGVEADWLDTALLDVQLADGRSAPAAARLRERGIPFVVATGYDRPPERAYAGMPLLSKPYRRADLIDALRQALDTAMPL
jgi:CheY-like chemotaxis protein